MGKENNADRIWTAALLVIGDEILSGRTQDQNLAYLARWLNGEGIRLKEARVVPDDMQAIGEALHALSDRYDYVFTTGGIGPTHDDITVDAVAAAWKLPVVLDDRAVAILKNRFGNQLTNTRLRMARVPEGASLIPNHETGAPGIHMGNLFLMAGVPSIMQSMLESLSGKLQGGRPMLARTVGAWAKESRVATLLQRIEKKHAGVKVGSYPFWRDGKAGANFVLRSVDQEALDVAAEALKKGLIADGIEPHEGEI